MNNKPRIHVKNAIKLTSVKSAKGHAHANSGHALYADQTLAVYHLAKWEGKTQEEYVNDALAGVFRASIDDVISQLQHGSAEEKKAALSLLRSLPEQFRPAKVIIELAPLAPGVVSKSLADEAKAALDKLQRAGAAAISLLTMSAHTLSEYEANHEPKNDDLREWRQLIGLNSEGAILNLAIDQAARFKNAMVEWRIEQLSIIAGELRAESKAHIEHEVYCLNTLNQYVANILTDHYSHPGQSVGPLLLCGKVCENLADAFQKSLTMLKQLHDAVEGPAKTQSLKKTA